MQSSDQSPSAHTWLDIPQDNTKPTKVLQQLLKQLADAPQPIYGRRFTNMLLYLIKVAGLANIPPDHEIEPTSWRLACKVTNWHTNKSTTEANCKLGVLSKADWGTMQQEVEGEGHHDLQDGDVRSKASLSSTPRTPQTIMLKLHPCEPQEKVLVIEVWGSPSKCEGRKLSLASNDKSTMPVFLGRACTSFQDTGIAGTELTLFSHSKKHEKGKLSVQLSFEVPQFDASIQEALEGYEVLFKAIVKHESQKEGDGCTRKWSAELSPVAKDLLLTYAKWYAIDTLQSITIEMRLLLDYNQAYGVNIKAFYLLLEEVMRSKEEGVTDTHPDSDVICSDVISTNHEETKPDSSTIMTSSPSCDPTSPSSTRSEVTSPFSSEPLPHTDVPSKQRRQTFRSESESTAKAATSFECDKGGAASNASSPQATKQEVVWPDELKQVLGLLRAYITEMLNRHLFIFDITKPEELEEYLKALKMLYTLHPIDDELRNFQTMLENCVKNGVQHWVSVCNAETQPDKGGSGYNAKSLKAQAEACNAKCEEVQEHIVDLFNRFGVDFFTIFIQIIGSKLNEFCMPKEEEIRTLDSNTIDIYYNAYLTCRQIEKCASLRLAGEMKLWMLYKPLVGQWIENAHTKCKECISKAVEMDEFVKVVQGAKHSASAVDVTGFLFKMLNFWDNLGWPDDEEAFGYGLKHIENLFQCATYYIDESYQHFSDTYISKNQGKFSVSEKVCVFMSNMIYVRDQVTEVSQKLNIRHGRQCQGDEKTFGVLKDCTEHIEQKIQSCMVQICERLTLEITQGLRNTKEQAIEYVKDFLASNLTVFKEHLLDDVYRYRILCIVWGVTLKAVQERLSENESEIEREKLHNVLTSLQDFFNNGLTMEELGTPQCKEIELQCLPTKDLISKCCMELAEQQPTDMASSLIGELSFSIAYLEAKSVLEVNILNAKLVTGDKNRKDGSADSFVQIWLLPQAQFQECTKGSYKTDLKKGTLTPVYYKELQLPAKLEDLRGQGAILVLAVYFKDMSHIAGLCVVPCRGVPVLQNEAGRQKLTLPLFLAKIPKSGPLKELMVSQCSRKEEAANFWGYLSKRLYVSPLD